MMTQRNMQTGIRTKRETPVKIAVITSRFNEAVTTQLKTHALQQLAVQGISMDQVIAVDVPGAIEIPLIAKQFAKKGGIDAIICLGAVIRGETSHYDYVCAQVSHGCQQVMLQYDIPVIFGILTTETEKQALTRVRQGATAVDVALEMIALLDKM